jgi:hypothetical protein
MKWINTYEVYKKEVLILESERAKVEDIDKKFYSGVYNGGFGTDEQEIEDAIYMIQDLNHLKEFDAYIKKNYASGKGLQYFLNDELEVNDVGTIEKIKKHLDEVCGGEVVTYTPFYKGSRNIKKNSIRINLNPTTTKTPAKPETPKPNDNEYWQKQAQEQANKNTGPKPLPDNEGPKEKEFKYQFPNEKNYSYAFKDNNWYAMNVKSKKKFNLTYLSTNGFEAYKKTIENLEKLRGSQLQQSTSTSTTTLAPTTNTPKESEASTKTPESEQEKEAEDWYSTLTLA